MGAGRGGGGIGKREGVQLGRRGGKGKKREMGGGGGEGGREGVERRRGGVEAARKGVEGGGGEGGRVEGRGKG